MADPFEEQIKRDLFPKVEGSAVVVSLCPAGQPDVKFCVELGAAIMFGKPIIAVAGPGREVPPGLRRIAAAVVEGDVTTTHGRDQLQARLSEVLGELGEHS